MLNPDTLISRKMSKKKKARTSLLKIIIVILALLTGASLGLAIFFFVIRSNSGKKETSQELQIVQNKDVLAKQVFDACQKEPNPQTCYERDIPKLMDTISMVDAFKVVSYVQQMDPSYQYCHTLGHSLASKETLKSPADWRDVYKSCPRDRACANSCAHGVVGEVYKDISIWSDFDPEQQSVFLSDLRDLCNSILGSEDKMDRTTCFETIGHVAFFLHLADPNDSLGLCDALESSNVGEDALEACYRGVFGSILNPLEADEKEMMKGKEITKDTYEEYCQDFFGVKENICIELGAALYKN